MAIIKDKRFVETREDGLSFKAWMALVNTLVSRFYGCSLYDLPDMCFRDAYDSELSPLDFFDEEVAEEIEGSGFGDIVEEVQYVAADLPGGAVEGPVFHRADDESARKGERY